VALDTTKKPATVVAVVVHGTHLVVPVEAVVQTALVVHRRDMGPLECLVLAARVFSVDAQVGQEWLKARPLQTLRVMLLRVMGMVVQVRLKQVQALYLQAGQAPLVLLLWSGKNEKSIDFPK